MDKEGRTFEFSKDVIEIERQFSNTHKMLYKDAEFREKILLKYFQKLFVGMYVNKRQLLE